MKTLADGIVAIVASFMTTMLIVQWSGKSGLPFGFLGGLAVGIAILWYARRL